MASARNEYRSCTARTSLATLNNTSSSTGSSTSNTSSGNANSHELVLAVDGTHEWPRPSCTYVPSDLITAASLWQMSTPEMDRRADPIRKLASNLQATQGSAAAQPTTQPTQPTQPTAAEREALLKQRQAILLEMEKSLPGFKTFNRIDLPTLASCPHVPRETDLPSSKVMDYWWSMEGCHVTESVDAATMLFRAACESKQALVDLMAGSGKTINARDADGVTALHLAALHGNAECAALLIKQNAMVKAVDESGATPLHYASAQAKQDVIRVLLNAGAIVNATDHFMQTPLMKATIAGQIQSISTLLAAHASVKPKDLYGLTVLDLAVHAGNQAAYVKLGGKAAAFPAAVAASGRSEPPKAENAKPAESSKSSSDSSSASQATKPTNPSNSNKKPTTSSNSTATATATATAATTATATATSTSATPAPGTDNNNNNNNNNKSNATPTKAAEPHAPKPTNASGAHVRKMEAPFDKIEICQRDWTAEFAQLSQEKLPLSWVQLPKTNMAMLVGKPSDLSAISQNVPLLPAIIEVPRMAVQSLNNDAPSSHESDFAAIALQAKLLTTSVRSPIDIVDPPARDKGTLRTALFHACSMTYFDEVSFARLLLPYWDAANNRPIAKVVEVKDAFGQTPLHALAMTNDTTSVQRLLLLLAHGANPMTLNASGQSPLMLASLMDRPALVWMLALCCTELNLAKVCTDFQMSYDIGTTQPQTYVQNRESLRRIARMLTVRASTSRSSVFLAVGPLGVPCPAGSSTTICLTEANYHWFGPFEHDDVKSLVRDTMPTIQIRSTAPAGVRLNCGGLSKTGCKRLRLPLTWTISESELPPEGTKQTSDSGAAANSAKSTAKSAPAKGKTDAPISESDKAKIKVLQHSISKAKESITYYRDAVNTQQTRQQQIRDRLRVLADTRRIIGDELRNILEIASGSSGDTRASMIEDAEEELSKLMDVIQTLDRELASMPSIPPPL
ncbi:hypothetical protein CAOG_00190 [Capsaspora owczarzaki ATCC 30864]|uniref:hypothetical protein n=1 Tax=Capsaspora owczarzaki (strain ATCC 30864) TaxID=595528 RepID=UPI0001FE6E0C|nr:hypothetical protein CAOG_00190 [Capsaspora owczarzaki ATCC 30864]|eukprot:XP_004365061.1 hypothetical protein CAOG_00190 [Capsaspora owczarzaki ATCC 30864]